MNGEILEEVNSFDYCRVLISKMGGAEDDVMGKVNEGTKASVLACYE